MATPAPELVQMARDTADAEGVPQELVLGVIDQESRWNPDARSGAGAIGLMQVMPIWASDKYASSINMKGLTAAGLRDPQTNLTAGVRILSAELNRFGSPALAAMAYNAGAPAVFAAIKKAGSQDPSAVSQYLPAETQDYWGLVLSYAQRWLGQALDVAEEGAEVVAANPGTSAAAGLLLLGLVAWFVWGRA